MISDVSIARVDKSIDDAIHMLFQLEEPEIGRGSNVVIKINLCMFRPPETGEITDPRVLESLVKYLIEEYHAKVTVVEADATVGRPDLFFKAFGYDRLREKYGFGYINLAKDDFVEKEINGLFFKRIRVARTIDGADLFITLPKLKNHIRTKVSICLKNQFGALVDPYKVKYHPRIDDVIADANTAMPPDFCVVDAIISNDLAFPKHTNLLAAGRDPVAVDAALARAMGFNPCRVGHIRKSERQGVGSMKYNLRGDELPRLDFSWDRMGNLVTAHPIVQKLKLNSLHLLMRSLGLVQREMK